MVVEAVVVEVVNVADGEQAMPVPRTLLALDMIRALRTSSIMVVVWTCELEFRRDTAAQTPSFLPNTQSLLPRSC